MTGFERWLVFESNSVCARYSFAPSDDQATPVGLTVTSLFEVHEPGTKVPEPVPVSTRTKRPRA